MSLTDHERRRLDEMTQELQRTDRALVDALSAGRPRRRSMHRIGTACVVLAAVPLVIGIGATRPAVCLVAWGVFTVGMCLRNFADHT